MTAPLPGWKDKVLFTPGPLTTSRTVRQAMLRDLGSRDPEFIEVVRDVRRRLLEVAGVSQQAGWEAVPVQGSGTFGLEAVVGSALPRDGKLLVVVNGAYGRRLVQMARALRIEVVALEGPEDRAPEAEALERALAGDGAVTHVAAVHCETTSGIVNPVEALGLVAARHGRPLLLDGMSSFGALPLDLEAAGVHFLVSSANKCIEGVPGFSFVLARRESLQRAEGQARSLSLDLFAQWRGLEADGQFRFTPPTHALLAFRQALVELEDEGGPAARGARYAANQRLLLEGMRRLGFEPWLPEALQGPIITSFRYLAHPRFAFEPFSRRLSERGYVIYPGKVSGADCFRLGSIGRIFPADVRDLVGAVREVLGDMGIPRI
jgi:2-aminoethylphosphonate-pyruvate transaminase